ncbi:MAG: hypothetical protein EBU90_27000 [Proteobacteria bacterium]|nr:hypothetical protein [Pseudomonadota bacterium]
MFTIKEIRELAEAFERANQKLKDIHTFTTDAHDFHSDSSVSLLINKLNVIHKHSEPEYNDGKVLQILTDIENAR